MFCTNVINYFQRVRRESKNSSLMDVLVHWNESECTRTSVCVCVCVCVCVRARVRASLHACVVQSVRSVAHS